MIKTIRIDNLKDVKVGDMLFVKGRSDGFRVACVQPIGVDDPFGYGIAYISKNKFVCAERTIDEPEWPHPDDKDMHVYLGADGEKYIYIPLFDIDEVPWARLPLYDDDNIRQSAESMLMDFPGALPLQELTLVLK